MSESSTYETVAGDGAPILIAPAWPYANGPRHIGHVAGFAVPADCLARYYRLRGNPVLMASGTDEHGTPVMVAANEEGVDPRTIADRYNGVIRHDLRDLGITYDCFSRTTTATHARVVQDIFRTLHANGYLFPRETMGAFSAISGHALPDRYLEGTCPHCRYPNARGDQCDACGLQLDPVDLINPHSRIDGTVPVFRATTHLYFDLPAFRDQLHKWISRQRHWRPNVRNFSLRLLEDLQPRPVTRDLDWGVPVPVAPYESDPQKRIYVWFDAVIGYLSASIEWAENRNSPDAWRWFWQHPEARHFYVHGKDNIPFHSVMWPSMLIGYGAKGPLVAGHHPLMLPYNLVASEYLTMEGKKFASSRGIVIYVRDFLEQYDADALRYYLVAAGPEARDTDFTWSAFVRRTNDELVATWGNLVHRTLTVAARADGCVPEPGALADRDRLLLDAVAAGFNAVGQAIESCRFKLALQTAMGLAARVNQYLNAEAPWTIRESDPARMRTVVYTALQCIDDLKTQLTPFIPFSCQRLHEQLGFSDLLAGDVEERQVTEAGGASHSVLTGDYQRWRTGWESRPLRPGQRVGPPEPLFVKLHLETVIETELAALEAERRTESSSEIMT